MSTNEPGGQFSPQAETIRISLDPEPGAAPPVPPSAMPQRSSGGLGVILAIVGAIFALGVVGVGTLTCAGVAFFLMIADENSAEYEAQTVYSPPLDPVDYSAPYAETTFDSSNYSAGATAIPVVDYGTTAYDPSYAPATTEYAPVVETTYEAPVYETPTSEVPIFDFAPVADGFTRAAELEASIAADQQLLADLDGQLALAGIVGGLGGIAAQQGETVDDQAGGVILGVGANAVAQQLQSERDAVAIRLNANRTALAELRAAGY